MFKLYGYRSVQFEETFFEGWTSPKSQGVLREGLLFHDPTFLDLLNKHVESKFVRQNFKQKTLENRASANNVRCPGSVLLNGWPRNLMLLVKRTPAGNIEPPNWDVCKLLLLSGINQATTNPKVGVCFWCPKHQQYFQLKEWCFCLLKMTFNPSTNTCHGKSSKHFNGQRQAVKLVLVMSLLFFFTFFCTIIPHYSMSFPDFSVFFCWWKTASVWSFADVVGWVPFWAST